MSKPSQKELILRHLQEHRSISPRDAREDYQVERLSARIFELKKDGYEIEKKMKVHPETGKRYTRYVLKSMFTKQEKENMFSCPLRRLECTTPCGAYVCGG